MGNIQNFVGSTGALIVAAVASFGAVAVAMIWSKYPIRWILAVATVVLGFLVFRWKPGEIDEQLPAIFRDYLQAWVFGLGLVAIYSLTHLGFTMVRQHTGPSGDGPAEGPFADVKAAWNDILIQLSHERINLAGQDLYLLIAPDEALAEAVVGAAGLQFFATAPSSPEAPIHCHATSDALFLSCSGATALGRQDAEATARLEFLCRLISEANPDRPILRGIALLIPFDWARGAESLRQATAVRDDLTAIRRTLKVRCPTFTVCCLQESIPGFNDFAARLPSKLRQNRCGFSVPASMGSGGEVIGRGMLWMTRWFQAWSLKLMVDKIHDDDGNGRLVGMNVDFRKSREALVKLLESGLTMHQQAEPVLYRGCYFVACGPTPDRHAFAAGLLSGARKGRLLADKDLTTWSREADKLDRTYRRLAWAIGLASAAIAVPVWCLGIIPELPEGRGVLGWLCLAGLGAMWVAVLVARRFRKPAPATA